MYQLIKYYCENTQVITNFKLASRNIWGDHISYTRNVIISILAGLPDTEAINNKLLNIQTELGVFIAPFYPAESISTLVDLLKQHIIIAGNVINGEEGAEATWRSNGNDIVNQMANMNPVYWPKSTFSLLWSRHLDQTIAQVTARNASKWEDDIAAYDLNHMCINEFSDLFVNGIVYQNIHLFSTTED